MHYSSVMSRVIKMSKEKANTSTTHLFLLSKYFGMHSTLTCSATSNLNPTDRLLFCIEFIWAERSNDPIRWLWLKDCVRVSIFLLAEHLFCSSISFLYLKKKKVKTFCWRSLRSTVFLFCALIRTSQRTGQSRAPPKFFFFFLLECCSYCGHYYYYLVWPAAVWPLNFSVGRLLSADPLIDSIVTSEIKATGGTRSSLMGLPAATELPLKRYGRHHRSVTLISGPYLVSVVIHRPTKCHILGFSCQNEMNDLLEVTFSSCPATGNQLAP